MITYQFKINQKIVYPSHGIGEIIAVEEMNCLNTIMQVYVIFFAQDKMTLKVPVLRAEATGLRAIADQNDLYRIYNILKGKAQSGNRMWSRRAQEYETKINSGNIYHIAEVVRDLYKNVHNDRSYSERNLYGLALKRLAEELALLEDITLNAATEKLVEILKGKIAAA